MVEIMGGHMAHSYVEIEYVLISVRPPCLTCREFDELINTLDEDGNTPLYLALENGMYSRVQVLLADFKAGTCTYLYAFY